jgi:hypothetical protein
MSRTIITGVGQAIDVSHSSCGPAFTAQLCTSPFRRKAQACHCHTFQLFICRHKHACGFSRTTLPCWPPLRSVSASY